MVFEMYPAGQELFTFLTAAAVCGVMARGRGGWVRRNRLAAALVFVAVWRAVLLGGAKPPSTNRPPAEVRFMVIPYGPRLYPVGAPLKGAP